MRPLSRRATVPVTQPKRPRWTRFWSGDSPFGIWLYNDRARGIVRRLCGIGGLAEGTAILEAVEAHLRRTLLCRAMGSFTLGRDLLLALL